MICPKLMMKQQRGLTARRAKDSYVRTRADNQNRKTQGKGSG